MTTRDPNGRNAREQRLADSEHSLRLLIESVQDYAIFMLDTRGIITSWNLGAQRIKGYAADEVIGRSFSIFYTKEALATGWPQEELRRARADGRFEDEGWRVRKDGTLIWANVVITAVNDEFGELLGFSKVTRDLTERRRHEQQLHESEERLRLIVDGVKDHALFLLDADWRIVTWNVAATRVLGHAPDEAIGQPAAMLYPAEERQAGKPQAERSAAIHAGFFNAEGWKLRADNTRIWASVSITVLHDTDGGLKGFVQILRDLTDQQRIHALESESRRILEFIAMLSHELRNPLAPMRNAVSLLQSPAGRPQLDRLVAIMGRNLTHLTRMVDDLLDVSRISAGKIELRRARLEINTLVQTAFDSMKPTLEACEHTAVLTLSAQPCFVDGDSVRLTQVIVNLLNNAAKYTPPHGRIEVCLSCDHAVVRIDVSDNGTGMTETLMEHAFEPFVQGERSLDRADGGLGIGLTLVKKILDLHAGFVAVNSAGPGKGSKFTVTLPLATRAAPATAPATAPASAAAAPARLARILVVDDNRDAAESLALLMQLEGHDVVLAHSGKEALEIALECAPTAVLLDIGLPDMSGHEVARRLRMLPALQNAQLIATTGYGQRSDKEATAAAGFDAHLVKPVAVDDVLKLLALPQARLGADCRDNKWAPAS